MGHVHNAANDTASETAAEAAAAADPALPRSPNRLILDAGDLGRVIDRIAHQILEKSDGARDTVLVGIPTRGAPLARRLAARMRAFEGVDVPVGVLDTTLYRDDLRMRGVRALEETTEPPGGVAGKLVVLVDDVLYSGRTVRAALDALRDLGRPRAVQLAVLVDRGHRELPIRADYVGKNIPTALTEQVKVLLDEVDGRDAVVLQGGTQ
ncbi:MAG: bifunctional pyr operon transcriptional regulator/uracil phosphoribosyltransferase PyrR [Geodermatophilaceae bacterium]|nr:bifunctional pyr operon transcriptional regulator/uracil phosphoribosyltransferase PyrR [Geodermatophilaceae bacterium]